MNFFKYIGKKIGFQFEPNAFFNNFNFQYKGEGRSVISLNQFFLQVFYFVRYVILVCFSIICSSFILEALRLTLHWDYFEIQVPFWVFFVLFVSTYIYGNFILQSFLKFGRYNIIFHFFFVVVVLNFTRFFVYVENIYINSFSYFLVVVAYFSIVTICNNYFHKVFFAIFIFYFIFVLMSDFEIFLLFSNLVLYRATRRRRRLRKKFFHIFVPSIAPAQKLVTLFYRQFGDTEFIWDYGLLFSSWFYVSFSCLVFFFSLALYHLFAVKFSGMNLFSYFFFVTIGFLFLSLLMYFLWVSSILFYPSRIFTGVRELYGLISHLGAHLDYQSYILFSCYVFVIFIVFRSWIKITRRVVFFIVGSEYAFDLDYKIIRPIIYGKARFPIFWKFPRIWLRSIFKVKRKRRRSRNPDAPTDAIYYYGGPNPNRVIFDPYTGHVIPIFTRDLVYENYRIYYKLYKFGRRRPSIRLFSIYEKWWTWAYMDDEFRASRLRNMRSFAPYYYYARCDLHSDYLLNRKLVFEDVEKDNQSPVSSEDDVKNFFDSYLWESIWFKGFGRSMPGGVALDFDRYSFINPRLYIPGYADEPATDPRENYQDALIFRRQFLFRQQFNLDRTIGFLPNEQFMSQNNGQGLGILETAKIGMRSVIFELCSELNSEQRLFISNDRVLQLISDLQSLYFRENYKFIPVRFLPRRRLWKVLRQPLAYATFRARDHLIVYSVLSNFVYSVLSTKLLNYYFQFASFIVSFTKHYYLQKCKFELSKLLGRIRVHFLDIFFIQLLRFGFSGPELWLSLDFPDYHNEGVPTPQIDNTGNSALLPEMLGSKRFGLFNSFEHSFERVIVNFPTYTYLSKWKLKFSALFEKPIDYFPNPKHGRIGRFRFVNPRIMIENETGSKINYFFVNLNQWVRAQGNPQLQNGDFTGLVEDYLLVYKFLSGELASSRYCATLSLLIDSFSMARLGGLCLSSRLPYKLELANPGLDIFSVTNSKYLAKPESKYGKLPIGIFTSNLLFDSNQRFSRMKPILRNFSVSGFGIPVTYMFSTTSSFYLFANTSQAIYTQFMASTFSTLFFQKSRFSKLRSARFRIPTFYPIFDQQFSLALYKFKSISSPVLNGLRSNYLKVCNFKGFSQFSSRIIFFKFTALYKIVDANFFGTELWLASFMRIFKKRWFFFGTHIRFFKNFTFFVRSDRFKFRKNKYLKQKYIKSYRWVYNWSAKFVWSVGRTARFEYYSAKKHSRFYESFLDRRDVYFLASTNIFNADSTSLNWHSYNFVFNLFFIPNIPVDKIILFFFSGFIFITDLL